MNLPVAVAVALLQGTLTPALVDEPAMQVVRTCVVDRLDPPTRAELAEDVARMIDEIALKEKNTGKPSADEVLATRIAACAAEHDWSKRQVKSAAAWVLTIVGAPVLADRAARRGMTLTGIEQAVASLAPDERAAILGKRGQAHERAMQRLFRAASEQGVALVLGDPERLRVFAAILGVVLARRDAVTRFAGAR